MIFKKGVNSTCIPSSSVASITGVNMLVCSKDSKSGFTKRKIRGAKVECGFFYLTNHFTSLCMHVVGAGAWIVS